MAYHSLSHLPWVPRVHVVDMALSLFSNNRKQLYAVVCTILEIILTETKSYLDKTA